jgi:hypothetical protein
MYMLVGEMWNKCLKIMAFESIYLKLILYMLSIKATYAVGIDRIDRYTKRLPRKD